MTKPLNISVLKVESYEKDGIEKLRLAVVEEEKAPDIVFFFDDLFFIEDNEGIQAQYFISLREANDGTFVPINEDDPRFDELQELSGEILEQMIESFIEQLAQTAEKVDSLLDVTPKSS
jgi:hypothetical protein